ncbi:hypothetical protein V8G54_035615, partial [Vigna mungo]
SSPTWPSTARLASTPSRSVLPGTPRHLRYPNPDHLPRQPSFHPSLLLLLPPLRPPRSSPQNNNPNLMLVVLCSHEIEEESERDHHGEEAGERELGPQERRQAPMREGRGLLSRRRNTLEFLPYSCTLEVLIWGLLAGLMASRIEVVRRCGGCASSTHVLGLGGECCEELRRLDVQRRCFQHREKSYDVGFLED